MRGTQKDGGGHRSLRPRFELLVLLLSLAVAISQGPAIGAAAKGSPNGNGGGKTDAAPTQVVSNQIDAFQGLLAGLDPSQDSSWTGGNLCGGASKGCYHELENVPHRIVFRNLKSGTTYAITVLVDAMDNAGHPGYDNVNSVVAFSGISGLVSVAQNPDTNSGCGTSTTCRSYTFTFTASDRLAEIRFNAHLALGAHTFGGASLSARLEDIGSRNVPLPVREILLDIRAHKFNDLNGNAVQDAGEPNLSGWTMTLYPGTTCSGSPVDVKGNPGVTDANGNVDWIDLSASQGDGNGDFSVAETLKSGWANTLPGASSTNAGMPCVVVGISGGRNYADFGNRTAPTPPPPPPPPPSGLGIDLVKDGPARVHVGDTITYSFAASLTTSTALTNITLIDPICDTAPTLVSKAGGDQDGTLEPGETWNYTCTHVVTATDPDPLPNTARVTGTASDGRQASDRASHVVDIIHPAIHIVKTASPTSVVPGETVAYTYVVTNTGDTTLYDVNVSDDKLGHICTLPQPLPVGQSRTCTVTFQVPQVAGPIDNIGTATGHDVLGGNVRDQDKASVDVVMGTTLTPPPTKTPPGGMAFTGAAGVVPLAGLAVLLLLAGTGILFLTRRLGRRARA